MSNQPQDQLPTQIGNAEHPASHNCTPEGDFITKRDSLLARAEQVQNMSESEREQWLGEVLEFGWKYNRDLTAKLVLESLNQTITDRKNL